MGKALGSWSGMRKYLEENMLAEPLKGRVRYNCSTGVGMDGCRFFEVYYDDVCIKRFSWETVNNWFIERQYAKKQHPVSIRDYWDGFWDLMEQYPMDSRTEYTDDEFCSALETYRNSDIQYSIRSSDPIVKMFALFDRRTGKRSLERIEEEMKDEPEWLQKIYRIRISV